MNLTILIFLGGALMLSDDELKQMYEEFWYIEEDETPTCASDAAIKNAENKLGIKLPADVVNLLKISDGGIPWLRKYTYKGEEYNLHDFFGVTPREKGPACIIPPPDYDGSVHNVPENVVVFSSQGLLWLGLDYRTSKTEPAVLHYDPFEDELVQIADNFRQFFEGLEED